MIEVIISLVFGLCLLAFLEWQHKQGKISAEVARKIVHITVALVLATWPFFVSWNTILIVEIIYLIAAALVRHYMPLDSQHKVGRLSWGEFFFSFGVILSILLGASRWIFIMAILHLGLADAVAALVGVKFGKNNSYKLLGQKKSIVGTASFFVVSCLLVALCFVFVPGYVTGATMLPLLLLPFLTTAAENIGVYGTDNLLIPLIVIMMLSA